MLMGHGYTVFHSSVNWGGSLASRASDLRDQLNLFKGDFRTHKKVHIIAHSMGGLDARKMMYEYEMYDNVASLTTIGTPHHGSSFADWVDAHAGVAVDLMREAGMDITGLRDLRIDRCAKFNELASPREKNSGVRFQAYAGKQEAARICIPLKPSHDVISEKEGDNDGLVSVKSARWNDDYYATTINADHLNEVGWWDVSEIWGGDLARNIEGQIKKFYLNIANSLTD